MANKLEAKFHFKKRYPEWFVSLALVAWGFIVYTSPGLFEISANFAAMRNFADQHTWGTAAMIIGAIRLVFLIINGSWRSSAHIRAVGSVFSMTLWSAVFYAYLSLDYTVPNLATIAILVALDLCAIIFGAEDAKIADVTRKAAADGA